MVQWVNQQDFSEKIKKEIIAAVPPTLKVAEDVVLCIDLATGKTLWKYKAPGEATGRMASSTPCVAEGRVYALGSTHFYAVDATGGKLIWLAPLPARGPASSPMVVDGVLVFNAGKLAAFDAATGKPLWTQTKAGGGNSSPVAWKSGGKTVIICNGRGRAGRGGPQVRRSALDHSGRRRLHAGDRPGRARSADRQPEGGHPCRQVDGHRLRQALEHPLRPLALAVQPADP